jgi:hypothetical protein
MMATSPARQNPQPNNVVIIFIQMQQDRLAVARD